MSKITDAGSRAKKQDRKYKGQSHDSHPMAFVNSAEQYREAADALLNVFKTKGAAGQRNRLKDPIYHLYFHTAELALKAYLRLHDIAVAGTRRSLRHELLSLYEECKSHGLVVGAEDRFDIGNVINLLDASNEGQALRYFVPKGRTLPDLDWTREAVGNLVEAVAASVEARIPDARTPGPAVKADMTLGKPGPAKL